MRATVQVRLIICPRDPNGSKTEKNAQGDYVGGYFCRGRRSGTDVWGRPGVVPDTGGSERKSLWGRCRSAKLLGIAEEWEDPVHLRPAGARELCQRSVSAFGHAALLVPPAASGAADGYLSCAARLPRIRTLLPSGRKVARASEDVYFRRSMLSPEQLLRSYDMQR